MAKKTKPMGMDLTQEEHAKWHRENRDMTPKEHEAFLAQTGISEKEDEKWHKAHKVPRPSDPAGERQPVNCFAIGGGFLAYCVKQGWLLREGKGPKARYYATPEGTQELARFGINLG